MEYEDADDVIAEEVKAVHLYTKWTNTTFSFFREDNKIPFKISIKRYWWSNYKIYCERWWLWSVETESPGLEPTFDLTPCNDLSHRFLTKSALCMSVMALCLTEIKRFMYNQHRRRNSNQTKTYHEISSVCN